MIMRKLANEELNRLSTKAFKEAVKIPLVVILDNIRSLNNIGSVFRTCDAFMVKKIFLCGITATPPHKDIHKTALGATESVDWEYFSDTVQAVRLLKEQNYQVLAIEQADKSTSLEALQIEKNIDLAIVFGHEVRGVDQSVIDACDDCIEIPQYGTKHSLNISVSAGIVIWDIFRKMKSQKITL
jgi:23S rRNA (guanosine2251-2'-O)-methyltransferase